MTTPRISWPTPAALRATPSRGRYQWTGKAGSTVSLDLSAVAFAESEFQGLGDARSVVSLDGGARASAVFLGFWRSHAPAPVH